MIQHLQFKDILSICGYLKKQGGKTKNWKQRWFSLGQEDEIECDSKNVVKLYYRDQREDRKHINFIVLSGGTTVRNSEVVPNRSLKGSNCSFEIITESKDGGRCRVYYLFAETEQEKEKWVLYLSRLCKMLAMGVHLQDEKEEEFPSFSLPSKAQKLLNPTKTRERQSSICNVHERESLDIMVDGASGLPLSCVGKKVSARVAIVNPSVSAFTWWEFSSTGVEKVDANGNVSWNMDFSYEVGSTGSEVIVRIVAEKTNEIIGESRFEPFKILTTTKSISIPLAVPLSSPVWEISHLQRNGGTLSDEDVENQGAKRVDNPRGGVNLHLSYSLDQTKGMLALLGLIATPLPLRLQTGDVLLFNQSTRAAKITKFFTWSKWSHAAMVVRRKSGNLSVIEATGDGVDVYDLDRVWWRYHKKADVGVCRLMVPGGLTMEDHDALYSFIETVKGRPYMKITTILSKLLSADEKQDLDKPSSNENDMTEVFCSHLVGICYRVLGLMSVESSSLLPKHFDITETTSSSLNLLRGAKLFAPRILPKNELAEY